MAWHDKAQHSHTQGMYSHHRHWKRCVREIHLYVSPVRTNARESRFLYPIKTEIIQWLRASRDRRDRDGDRDRDSGRGGGRQRKRNRNREPRCRYRCMHSGRGMCGDRGRQLRRFVARYATCFVSVINSKRSRVSFGRMVTATTYISIFNANTPQ